MIKYRIENKFTKIIDETKELRLEHEFESVYLVRKSNNQILLTDDFYGDPECGLIDEENKWTIVAGTHLTLWTPNSETKFQTEQFRNIHSIRLTNKENIKILTDPWANFSAIWELNVKNSKLSKVSDFRKYQGREYSENVEW